MDGFNFSQLSEFTKKTLKKAEDDMPKAARKFLKLEQKKLRPIVEKNVKETTGIKTGKLSKASKTGKVYKFKGEEDTLSARVFLSVPHAHLLNYGHNIVARGPQAQPNKGGSAIGFVQGREFLKKAQAEFEPQFIQDCEKFAIDFAADEYMMKNYGETL